MGGDVGVEFDSRGAFYAFHFRGDILCVFFHDHNSFLWFEVFEVAFEVSAFVVFFPGVGEDVAHPFGDFVGGAFLSSSVSSSFVSGGSSGFFLDGVLGFFVVFFLDFFFCHCNYYSSWLRIKYCDNISELLLRIILSVIFICNIYVGIHYKWRCGIGEFYPGQCDGG